MKITMQGIADLAGVSLATVSRAIHSPGLVRSKTREHVLRVVEETGYVYNATAGDFSRRRSTVIGVIIPTTKGAIFANSTQTIQEKAQEKGFSLIIGNANYDVGKEIALLRQFQERRLAGVILTGFTMGQEETVLDLVESGIPCVVVWETLKDSCLSFVGFDNFVAGRTMTQYLLDLNHKRIGLIIGPYTQVGRVKKRYEGYRAALREKGIPWDSSLVVETRPTLADGHNGMAKLLSLPNPPTAVFAASDMLAIGALAAIRERGLSVPRDVSLAGFDDIDFAAYCDPPLTTMRVPAQEMGEIAMEYIWEMIEADPKQARQCTLETKLVVRDSCKACQTV